MEPKPMGMLLMMLAGWVHRQQDMIEANPCGAGSGLEYEARMPLRRVGHGWK